MRFLFPVLLPVSLLAGCSKEEKDDTGGGGDSDSGADSAVNEFNPSVVSVDAVDCTKQQSAGELWAFTVTVTDPQGAETVDGGTVYARDPDGNELANYAFPCDDSGTCSGSFRAAYDNIGCSMGGTLVLGFVVADQTGNLSEELAYQTE